MVFFSCQKEWTKEEYTVFLNEEENGIVQKFEKGNLEIKAGYIPNEWMASRFLEEDLDRQKLDSIKRKLKDNLYFSLEFSANGKDLLSNLAGNRTQFGTLVNKLAFGLEDNVCLTTQSKDTLNLIDQHFPRYYGMSDANHVLLIFDQQNIKNKNQNLQLKLKDVGLKTGDISFRYKKEHIKRINKMHLKTEQ